jgi:plasmid stabilization system protein ParE
MARYTVTWHGQAEQDLADIWLSSSDREGITAAVEAIDLALATAADSRAPNR